MTVLLLAPLLPAALVAAAVALAALVAVPLGLAVGAALTLACGSLAAASADRVRRALWACAAASGLGVALRLVLGPIPGPDLAHLASLDGLRSELARALRILVPEPESGILLGI